MLIKLLKYELVKKWKVLRYVLIAYVFIETLILILTRGFLLNTDITKMFDKNNGDFQSVGAVFGLTMLLYFALAIFIGMFSIFEGFFRFGKDLSGKQSALEHMLPVASWKKVISKIMINLCSNVVCFGLSTLSIIMFILINSNFDKTIVYGILKVIQESFQSPARLVVTVVYILLCFFSMYAIIFCCIAFSKSISHKSRISVPIGIVAFAVFVVFCTFTDKLLIDGFPIINYSILGEKSSLSSNMMSLLIFFGALFATSWLMENKVEH